MANVFIIEGPDCAGKTTLSEQLTNYAAGRNLGTYYIHRSRIMTSAKEEYLDALDDLEQRNPDVAILDRWHISEDVYGPVMRGSSAVDDDLRAAINEKLSDLGAKVLYLDTTLDVVMDRFNSRGDDHIEDVITLARIWQRYYDLASDDWVRMSEVDDIGALFKAA